MNFLNNLSLSKVIGIVGPLIAVILSFNTLLGVYKEWKQEDHSGAWKLITLTEHSTKRSYIGLKLGYKVYINQDHEIIKGKGEKYYEYDTLITNFADHTPIEFSGKLSEGKMNLTFIEKGIRETSGSFRFQDDDGDGIYEGVFNSTNAARTGKCILSKENE